MNSAKKPGFASLEKAVRIGRSLSCREVVKDENEQRKGEQVTFSSMQGNTG